MCTFRSVCTLRSPLIAQKHKRKCRQAWIISADWQIAESQMLFEKDSKWIVSISTGSVPSTTIPDYLKCLLCCSVYIVSWSFHTLLFLGRRIIFKDGKILLRRSALDTLTPDNLALGVKSRRFVTKRKKGIIWQQRLKLDNLAPWQFGTETIKRTIRHQNNKTDNQAQALEFFEIRGR